MGDVQQIITPESYQVRFKSSEAAAKYLSAYEATLALWPIPHEAHDVVTSYGTTHINIAGAPTDPPLILIPGAQTSSAIWYPNVEPLSRHFRVYALDVLDQTGLSVPARRLKTPQDSVDWLLEVLDALALDKATIIGHSQGCWQALQLAKSAPQRVDKLVLLSPGPPFIQLRWQLLARMLPVFIMPTRKMFYWNFQWLTTMPLDANQPHPLIELLIIGTSTYKPEELAFGAYPLLSDDELRGVSTPTLLLIGDQERVVNPQEVIDRAQRLMPNLSTKLITDAGHLMPIDQAEAVNAHMLDFLLA